MSLCKILDRTEVDAFLHPIQACPFFGAMLGVLYKKGRVLEPVGRSARIE